MRIAVSGTYSTGKTTLTLALAALTGIPATRARSMREILPETFPGQRLEDCDGDQLFQLGITRYAERFAAEHQAGHSFISDGSSIHEWAYGHTRVDHGIHPSDHRSSGTDDPIDTLTLARMMDAFGQVVQRHARRAYDLFIHQPIEFPLDPDGHRPVSEDFRRQSDQLLTTTISSLQIPTITVHGSVEQRLTQTAHELGIQTLMSPAQAHLCARQQLSSFDSRSEMARDNPARLR